MDHLVVTPDVSVDALSGIERENLATFEILADAFRARSLMTPMGDAITLTVDDATEAAVRQLEAHDFDFAPVVNDQAVVGVVERRVLSASADSVHDAYVHLQPHLIISGNAPLVETLRWL